MERADLEQWKRADVARLIALLESERRYYQDMVAALPVGLAVFSRERALVSANRAFRRIFGIPAGELSGKTLDQILPHERLIERVRDLHVHGVMPPPIRLEHGAKTLRISLVPVRGWEDEGEKETLLIVLDVTGESGAGAPDPGRGSEISVVSGTSAQEPLTSVRPVKSGPVAVPPVMPSAGSAQGVALDSLPAIVWQADAETLVFTAVEGAVGMLGYPAAHWIRTAGYFENRMHEEDRAAVMDLYRSAIGRAEDGAQASAEFRIEAASGDAVWVRETISVRGGSMFGVVTHIGPRRDLERQRTVAARIEALQAIAARLSHDLNNPLMVITGYAEEMLDSVPQNDPRRADLEQILQATERMAALTEQLLQFTRKQGKTPQLMDLTAAIEAMEARIRKAAGSNVAVDYDLGEPAWTHADARQLEEAILALAAGTPELALGRTRVEIECAIEEIDEQIGAGAPRPGHYVKLTIRSVGSSVDAAKRDRMFESFLFKDPAGAPAAQIARAYSIVREWGGDIAFSSEGDDCAFTVLLPRAEAPEAPKARPRHREAPSPGETLPQALRETILVVDDEPGIRQLVAKILRRERHLVLEAGSAREAIAVAAQHRGRIDLLLTDVMLPDRSGREVAEQMREMLPGLKVLYISGFTDDESVRGGEYPTGAKFLQKPFTLGALMGKVRESLDQ